MIKQFEIHIGKAKDFLRHKMFGEALFEYQKALELVPNSIEVLSALGVVFSVQKKEDKAFEVLNKLVELYGDETPLDARLRLFELERMFLFWDHLDRDFKYLTKPDVLRSGRLNPYTLGAYLPISNQEKYHALRAFAQSKPELGLKMCPFSFSDREAKKEKLRLGFISADFRVHPSGYVVAEFFKLINRDKFDLYLYDIHPELDTYPSKHIYETTKNITQLNKLNDREAAQKIFDDKIDVLIDLNGFTSYNRLGIMTYQPAPAQGTFLGYIGTLGGVPGVDYHFMDKFSILPGQEKCYHEKLKYLEPTRWLIDHTIELPEFAPLRRHVGFKPDTIVLCCFNNVYKFTPNYFDLWARILKRVPAAVLWFYTDQQIVQKNIIKEFAKRGIPEEKIVISAFVNHTEHLARFKIADLLLDTEFYNAHTTAMEALFMGCPVITCPGDAFTSRVAGALLNALEMPELICKNVQEYEDKVVELCKTPGALKKLRQKVLEKGKTASLFDMKKFTRSFEKACREMYEESLDILSKNA